MWWKVCVVFDGVGVVQAGGDEVSRCVGSGVDGGVMWWWWFKLLEVK